jgi:hypothetical protein
VIRVPLLCSRHAGFVAVRDLCGHDEETVDGTDTAAAVELLDRLLVDPPIASRELAAPDRDRVLAEIYRRAFGDRIHADRPCARCGERFELELELGIVVDELAARTARTTDGTYRTTAGATFRPPTAEDELAVAALPPGEREAELRARCAPALGEDELAQELEAVAPLLAIELETTCPSCGHVDEVAFDVQSYLLDAIASEAAPRAREIHRLAMSYGWTLTEILGLPRHRRRTFAELIEREAR